MFAVLIADMKLFSFFFPLSDTDFRHQSSAMCIIMLGREGEEEEEEEEEEIK